MPAEWWFLATFPHEGAQQHLPLTKGNVDANKAKRLQAQRAFSSAHFAYCFKRTTWHVTDCDCLVCYSLAQIADPENRLEIHEEHGIRLGSLGEAFASCYGPGDFLTRHHDAGNGAFKFIYSLARDWRPEFGGVINFLDNEKSQQITRSIVPDFNTLTIFKIPPGGQYHYTSHVNPGVRLGRFALEGWFNAAT